MINRDRTNIFFIVRPFGIGPLPALRFPDSYREGRVKVWISNPFIIREGTDYNNNFAI